MPRPAGRGMRSMGFSQSRSMARAIAADSR